MTKLITILQVCRETPTWGFDLFKYISHAFPNDNYHIITIYIGGKKSEAVLHEYNGKIYFLGTDKDNLYHRCRRFLQILMICLKHKVKGVICHHYKPTTLMAKVCWLYPIKIKYSVHHNFNNFKKRNRKFFSRLFLKKWHFIAVSQSIKQNLIESKAGITAERVSVIYNAIDINGLMNQQLDRATIRAQLNIDDDCFVYGHVGRFIPWKAQACLISAFARIKPQLTNARLVLIGVGPLESALRAQVKDLGLEADIDIHTNIPDAFRYMPGFDVFVLPSQYEPFGLVLLEAMAASIPLIINNSGGAPEVTGTVAQIVPVDDVQALAQAMLGYYQLPKEQRQIKGEQGFIHLQNTYSIEQYQQNFKSLFAKYF